MSGILINYITPEITVQVHWGQSYKAFSHPVTCQTNQMPSRSLTASPLENWRRPPGRLRTTWMKTTQQDLKSMNLSQNEATDLAQNRPFWRLMCMFGATHS